MQSLLNITKALSDQNRIRALMMLRAGELCVCQVIEMLGLAPSTVSKHMSILRQANLVHGRKEGRWTYYSLAGRAAPAAVRDALKWMMRNLADDAQIERDAKRLQKILKIDRKVLCKRQIGN